MASIKNLKKDINFLTEEVIETCMVKLYFSPEKDRNKLFDIIDDFVNFRNNTIYKINHPEQVNGKNKNGMHYKNLMDGFIEKVNQTFDIINSINKEQEAK